jgi:hypothetical protein
LHIAWPVERPTWGECSCLESKTHKINRKRGNLLHANYPPIKWWYPGRSKLKIDNTDPSFTLIPCSRSTHYKVITFCRQVPGLVGSSSHVDCFLSVLEVICTWVTSK